MNELATLTEKIKILKSARDILNDEYSHTDFHKKKEANPDSTVPPKPEDAEIYKLLTALQQLELLIKKYQDQQFVILKQQDK